MSEEWAPYILGGVIFIVLLILIRAFAWPSKQNASDTEIAMLGATGGLAGAGKAAEVAEVIAAEAAPAEPGKPTAASKHKKVIQAIGMTSRLRHR